MNNNLDILDSQDFSLKKQLKKDAAAFREEKFHPDPEQYTELLDTRIQIRPDFRDKLIEQLKGTFDKYYDYHCRDIEPMKWIISMWKILMSSPIVHGNLNISENRKCDEISLQELRKSPMIWNCNHLRVDNILLQISCSKINSFQKGVWKSKLPYANFIFRSVSCLKVD